jgi:hypothetical protein
MGVSGPTRVRISLSLAFSMGAPPFGCGGDLGVHRTYPTAAPPTICDLPWKMIACRPLVKERAIIGLFLTTVVEAVSWVERSTRLNVRR